MAAIEERFDRLDKGMARIEQEVQEEGERTRTYMKVLIDDLRGDIRHLAQEQLALDERDLRQHLELKDAIAALGTRVTRLEVSDRRRHRRA